MAIKCVVCEKSIGRYDDYINCRSKCNNNFHISCVNLTEVQFAQLKESGTLREWSCTTCRATITSTELDELNINDTRKFEKYINHKISHAVEEITNAITTIFKKQVEQLNAENKNLCQELRELKYLMKKQISIQNAESKQQDVAPSEARHEVNIHNQQKKDRKYADDKKRGDTDLQQQKILLDDKKRGNTDLRQQKTLINENNYQNKTYADATKWNFNDTHGEKQAIVLDQIEPQKSVFNTVINKQKRKPQLNTTHGTATNIELKGSVRYAHLHMYGLEPTTTEADITNYLSAKGINNTKLEKLKSKHPEEYASYKLSVPFEMLEEAKKPELWPSGVRLNRFLEQIWKKSQHKT